MHDSGRYHKPLTNARFIDRELREFIWRVQSALYIIGDQFSPSERRALHELIDIEAGYAALERHRDGATFG
jgi:hypothetical protein